jgi:zinc protease
MLALIGDVALRPSFPAEEVERQRARRLAALVQQRDDPSRIADQVMLAAIYGQKHPYGHDTLGDEASVTSMTRDQLQSFWRQNFVPNNAALVVAGDITISELRALAEKVFGGWQRGAAAVPALATPSTPQARVIIVDKPGSPQTQVRVATVGAPRGTPDFRAMEVMNSALGGQFGSRINMNLRERHGYTYGARSLFLFRKAAGHFRVTSGIRTEVTGPAVAEIFKELRGIVVTPLTGEELRNAKEGMSASLPGQFETSASVVDNFATVFVYGLGLDYYSRFAEQVAAVTDAQAVSAARKYLVPDNMVVVAVGDRAKIEPELQKLGLGPIELRDSIGKPVAQSR